MTKLSPPLSTYLSAFLMLFSTYPATQCIAENVQDAKDGQEQQNIVLDNSQASNSSLSDTQHCLTSAQRNCLGHVSFSGELLYWLFSSGIREVSMSQVPTQAITDTGLPFFGAYSKQFISTSYKPGMRFGATYACCCRDWTLSALYTDFHAIYKNHFAHKNNGSLTPTQWPEIFSQSIFVSSMTGSNMTHSHSSFHLTYQMLDICLQYTPSPLDGCSRMWEPYFGVRLLNLEERWKVDYAFIEADSYGFDLKTKWKSKLPAIGGTCGIRGQYQLCKGFSLIGKIGASCVQGKVKMHINDDIQYSSSLINAYLLKDNYRDVFHGWEGAAGLAYAWDCPSYTVTFSLGYEVQGWSNMPARPHDSFFIPDNSFSPGLNFTLHGLFVKGSIFF